MAFLLDTPVHAPSAIFSDSSLRLIGPHAMSIMYKEKMWQHRSYQNKPKGLLHPIPAIVNINGFFIDNHCQNLPSLRFSDASLGLFCRQTKSIFLTGLLGFSVKYYFDSHNFAKRIKSGYGKYSWTNGYSYCGQFENGKRHGDGLLLNNRDRGSPWLQSELLAYRGQFEHGEMSGAGEFIWPDGSRYAGQFERSRIHGNGTLKNVRGNDWPCGTYTGEFKDGSFVHGKFADAYDDVYEGQFDAGGGVPVQSGKGKIKFDSGCVYEGEFKNGEKAGYGTFSFTNGLVYSGQFENGFPNGNGKLTTSGNAVYTGEFEVGSLPHGTLELEEGIYEGQFEPGYAFVKGPSMSGHGKMQYKDGDVYEGQFKNGKIWGHGKLTYQTCGEIDEGYFENSALNGPGISLSLHYRFGVY